MKAFLKWFNFFFQKPCIIQFDKFAAAANSKYETISNKRTKIKTDEMRRWLIEKNKNQLMILMLIEHCQESQNKSMDSFIFRH